MIIRQAIMGVFDNYLVNCKSGNSQKKTPIILALWSLVFLQNFKNNSLLSHESEVNKLQDDGDRLVELKHPAASTVQVTLLCDTLDSGLTPAMLSM